MFAGSMKLRTFLALSGSGVALLGAAYLLFAPEPVPGPSSATPTATVATQPRRTPPVTPATPPPEPEPNLAPPPSPEAQSAYPFLEPAGQFIVAQAGRDLGTSKVKDATKGSSYKVNLYQDKGKATINRAKVDVDRDDVWDEKWTFKSDGSIVRSLRKEGTDSSFLSAQTLTSAGWQD